MSRSHSIGIKVLAPQSNFYQGPFGRLCPELEPWVPTDDNGKPIPDHKLDDHFKKYADKHMVEAPGKLPDDIANDAALRTDLDNKFNSNIPAGYTYFGQFIDHDITFDPHPPFSGAVIQTDCLISVPLVLTLIIFTGAEWAISHICMSTTMMALPARC